MRKKTRTTHHGRGVELFLAQHGADVTGVIAGFDRLRLRGSLRDLYQPICTASSASTSRRCPA
jgi:hypothetical protein